MAVAIRLARFGMRKRPTYRIVVADSRAPRDGRFIERIGLYDPNQDPVVIRIEEERALKWLRRGAQPSETVRKLMTQIGLIEKLSKADET